jgi:hypothetical protein
MRLLSAALAITLLASTAAAKWSDVTRRQQCGATNGACNKNGCDGVNDPETGFGVCLGENNFQFCPCTNACGTNGPCNGGDCKGDNDPSGGPGRCTSGFAAGCFCNSVCGTPGPCDQAGCEGRNQPGGGLGICTAGDFKGCLCTSVCGASDGACDADGCEGVNGYCTSGKAKGCSCGSKCSNTQMGPCSNCNGITEGATEGVGICAGGDFDGCLCSF